MDFRLIYMDRGYNWKSTLNMNENINSTFQDHEITNEKVRSRWIEGLKFIRERSQYLCNLLKISTNIKQSSRKRLQSLQSTLYTMLRTVKKFIEVFKDLKKAICNYSTLGRSYIFQYWKCVRLWTPLRWKMGFGGHENRAFQALFADRRSRKDQKSRNRR